MGNDCCGPMDPRRRRKATSPILTSEQIKIIVRKDTSAKKNLYDKQRSPKFKQYSTMISNSKSIVELTEIGFTTLKEKINIHKLNFSCFVYNQGHVEFITTKKNLQIWRKVEAQPQTLFEGDEIRLGSSNYIIKYFRKIQPLDEEFQYSRSILEKDTECRICFMPSEHGNPLINACKCSGSLGHTHKECLSKWIFKGQKKAQKEGKTDVSTLKVNRLQCEICKENYQSFINEFVFAKYIQQKPGFYVVLELRETKDTKTEYSVFYFDKQQKQLKIGRSRNCDYEGKDPSISKTHCSLMIKEEKLMIRDLNSRFGTGILSCNQLNVNEKYQIENKQITFQVFL